MSKRRKGPRWLDEAGQLIGVLAKLASLVELVRRLV
jgi:hypothetical protein